MPRSVDQRPRSSKGERTRRSILRAAAAVVAEEGLAAASQEQVARRADLSQSALRHHFPSKDDLIRALFDDAHDRHRAAVEAKLLEPGRPPRQRLLDIAASHLEFVIGTSDSLIFESFARATRVPEALEIRNDWYRWLADHYAELVARIHPELDERSCRQRALGIVTVSLGAWVTAGASRPDLGVGSTDDVVAALLATIEAVIDATID